MIVRILSQGTSFKGLTAYLTHDPGARTTERVGWTHTMNLSHDHVPSAVDEMLWTARSAELLKQEAGIRAGGRSSENIVKHISLNWAPDDNPSREQMVEAAEGFLKHMNWHEHQALLVSHDDKSFHHVHLMLNTVHPETGLHLDDGFERRRAQVWALAYEQDHERIHCPQRLKDVSDREEAPTRPAWQAFRETHKEFEREEKALNEDAGTASENQINPRNIYSADWQKLKEMQRHEHEAFFAEGKIEFSHLRSSICREVRAEFKDRWNDYYTEVKRGADDTRLATIKTELVAEQSAALEERRDSGYSELRAARSERYQTLLQDQQEQRGGLRSRQELGLDSEIFFQFRDESKMRSGYQAFRDAACETTLPEDAGRERAGPMFTEQKSQTGNAGMKSAGSIGLSFGDRIASAALSLLGGLAEGPEEARCATRPSPQDEPMVKADPFDDIIRQARGREREEQEEADREDRKRQRAYGE